MSIPPPELKQSSANGPAGPGGTSEFASTSDIPDQSKEMRLDELSKAEKKDAEIENRQQLLSSNLLEQKHTFQGYIFSVAVVVICVFYLCFILVVMTLVCSSSHDLFKTGFPATATVLIGMLGSIPTILTAFLMTGLFREKESKDKDKDDKSPIDISTVAKIVSEAIKAAKH